MTFHHLKVIQFHYIRISRHSEKFGIETLSLGYLVLFTTRKLSPSWGGMGVLQLTWDLFGEADVWLTEAAVEKFTISVRTGAVMNCFMSSFVFLFCILFFGSSFQDRNAPPGEMRASSSLTIHSFIKTKNCSPRRNYFPNGSRWHNLQTIWKPSTGEDNSTWIL